MSEKGVPQLKMVEKTEKTIPKKCEKSILDSKQIAVQRFITLLTEARNAIQDIETSYARLRESLDALLNTLVIENSNIRELWNPDRIVWQKWEGKTYEVAEKDKQTDQSREDFDYMVKDLEKHNGFMQRAGKKYWFYLDNKNIVCRR